MSQTKFCVDAILKNDRDGMNEIYKTIRPQVFRYFNSRGVRDMNMLEDVFQDAIMNIYIKAKKGEITNSGSCFGLIKQYCYFIIGNRKQKKSGNEEMFEHFDKLDVEEDADIVRDMEEQEKEACFWNNLRKMSKDCITVISMRRDGKKHQEIADHLGVTSNAATVRFFKCLKKLTDRIKADPMAQEYLQEV